MDKRFKRNEASDKKNDKVKDRGDNMKRTDRMLKKNACENALVNAKPAYPERGDSVRKISTNQRPEKMRLNVLVKKTEDTKKASGEGVLDKEHHIKKTDKDGQDKFQDVQLRKRIRDKYTLKLKGIHKIVHSNSNLNKKDDCNVVVEKSDANKNAERPKKQLAEETTQTKEKLFSINSSNTSGKTEVPDKKPERNAAEKQEKISTKRKPMIKTIMSKNGPMKIYKAVTFVDQRRPRTPLEINIPGDSIKKHKVSKFTDTSSLKFRATVSRVSIKEKPVAVRKKPERKRDRKNRHVPSPEESVRANLSPPTEVARWAPSSIDQYTKPYYEAWVNTTLAAISKSSKKDKQVYEKQRRLLLESFQRALEERPRTPELFYENFHDERYTGRIKIRQR